ncbi:MoaD/ThiS family protein [Aquimarina rhabdastrellae]
MNLKIKYFGMLTEVTGCTEEQFPLIEGNIADVLQLLMNKYPLLKEKEFQVAQDQVIVDIKKPISQGEIALLPPFSGG